MELGNIKTFIRAAETGSFTAAALQENYAQSTVTQKIRAIERELGAELFVRSGRRVSLSSAGREFLSYARRMVALEQETLSNFHGTAEPAGEFFVGMIETIATSRYMEHIGSFLRQYPKVRLHVTVDTAPRLRQDLIHGNMDLVILLDQMCENARLRVLHHMRSEIQFIAPADSMYAHRPVRLEELIEASWILTERGTNYRKKLEDDLAERQLYLHDRVEIGTSKTIIDFVAAGLGLSLLPAERVADAVRDGRVAVIDVTDYRIDMQLQILAADERWLPPPLALLADSFVRGMSG
ncbi:LysR family transcriptional regulator [Selenomonas sp. TAMA-11512]|uniref:LysR family transcriptional regulator n=1 Tax=Selenomonas sp. TAMA-11512 TaxID=3095337 RepID=UPI00308A06AA|nr:LysR family transcriptional regulator [Selenomonas sp. TAMA-11512]